MAELQRRVWVWVKRDRQALSRDSRAAVARAVACGATVTAITVVSAEETGQDWSDLAGTLGTLGVDTLIALSLSPDAAVHPAAFSNALTWAVHHSVTGAKVAPPTDLLASADVFGRDLLARAAAALRVPLLQDCVALDFAEGTGEKYLLSGRTRVVYDMPEGLRCWTLRPNVYSEPPASKGMNEHKADVHVLSVPAFSSGLRLVSIEPNGDGAKDAVGRFWAEQPDLAEASVVVSGGRAVGSRENFALLHDVAAKLHASVGASRSAVDMGFAPPTVQVGQTGMVISPELYITFGISGSVFHLAGIRTARRVVAVDTDPRAPIFARADFGLQADLFEVLPLLRKLL